MTDRTLDLPDLHDPAPERVAQLRTAELFALAAGRLWVSEYLHQDDGAARRPCWRSGFVAADLDEAAVAAFDQLFQAFAGGATRQIEFRCPNCPRLSLDEQRFLRALAYLQRDRRAAAAAILGDWLAPAATRIALNAAHAVAGAIAQVGLILPWRNAGTAPPNVQAHYADQGIRLIH